MSLSYADFKTYITTFLWRQNDPELTANLDNLIAQANSELSQLTRDWQRRLGTTTIEPETEDYVVTDDIADFEAVRYLTNNKPDSYYATSAKMFSQVSPSRVYELRAKHPGGRLRPFYAIERLNNDIYLRLVGPLSAENPGEFTLGYRTGIPDYATTDSSWLEEEYTNLYVYTIMKHAARFLRDEKRVADYSNAQAEAFKLADMDDKHNLQFGGSPLVMQSPRQVP